MKISERGQITIPEALRAQMGLHRNVEIDITPVREGLLIRKRTASEHPVHSVYGILKSKRTPMDIWKRFGEDDYGS